MVDALRRVWLKLSSFCPAPKILLGNAAGLDHRRSVSGVGQPGSAPKELGRGVVSHVWMLIL